MSDTELNILELKKKLSDQNLYKPGMNFIDMEQVYHLFKCKQAIEAEGLYETGMSSQDIKDLYNTLKKSKESAGNDKEYREILNRTETNCNNIEVLIEESNTINNDETVDPVVDVDVTTIQTETISVSPKPQSVSKSFASLFKKNNEKQSIKNINVILDVKTNHPLLKLRNMDYSNGSLIYYHQKKILKLPLTERATAISQYLLNLQKYRKNDTNNKIKWSKPIQPQQDKPFNGDFCVDFIPDIPEECEEEKDDSFKIDVTESPPKDNINSYISNRPKRVAKRKNYIDEITDDEDDFTTIIKKTKNNDDSSNENTPESKWIKRKKRVTSNTPPLYLSTGNDRISKIFDKLKWGDSSNTKSEKKSTAQSLQETLNLSDSDEELFPPRDIVTTANIHKDEDQAAIKSKNAKTPKAKKLSPRKRATYNKLAIQKNSATKENESPEIPTHHFYAKNKNSDIDESNNNKLDNSEEVTNCPICNRPYPVSKIEVHASNCMQYEGKDAETCCEICNEMIPDKKLQSHRYECLNKITEASIAVDKPVTRSQRMNGFLCHICDKYISNTSQILHASNCIAEG